MISLTWKSNRDFWLCSGIFMITFNWVHALNLDLGKLSWQFNFLQRIFCALLLVNRIRFIRIYLNAFSSEHFEARCCALSLLIFNYLFISLDSILRLDYEQMRFFLGKLIDFWFSQANWWLSNLLLCYFIAEQMLNHCLIFSDFQYYLNIIIFIMKL